MPSGPEMITNYPEKILSSSAKRLACNRFPARRVCPGSNRGLLISILMLGSALLSLATAQAPAKTLSEDFRLVTTIKGSTDTSIVTGHAVGSPVRMRIDVTTRGDNSLNSPIMSSGKVGMIVTDSGHTITYIDSEKRRYIRVRPAELVQQAQQMGGMRMEFSETMATVDSLGAGPVILGHPTLNYRVATGMTISMTAIGQQQVVKVSNSIDYYYASDIKGELNPFATLSGGDMLNMLGASNKDFVDKAKAVQQKLPKGTPLRALYSATMVSQGQTRVTNSAVEVTGIQWVAADPKAFEVPANYTAQQLPGTGGSSGGAIPPM
jgi:hypothetical protein